MSMQPYLEHLKRAQEKMMKEVEERAARLVKEVTMGVDLSPETVRDILAMNPRTVAWDNKTTLPPPGPLPPPPPGFFKPLVGGRLTLVSLTDVSADKLLGGEPSSPQECDEPIIVERNSYEDQGRLSMG